MRKVSALMGVVGLLTFAAGCSDVEASCGPGQVRDTDGLCKLPCELADTDCDDGNDCTADGCNNLPDLTAECTNVTKADDTNCTIDGLSGWCVSGQCDLCVMVNCDDGNDCTADGKCNDVNGQCEGGTNEDLDTKCDHDGGSVCDGAGNCVECNNASQCAEDDNQCTAASCESNQCGQSPVTDGNSCDFGVLPGICQAGVCFDAKLCAGKDCSDGLECTEDLCDPETGICSNPDEPDSPECDGGRGTCQSGVCVPKCEGKDCDDGNDCTEDGECNEFTGECPPKEDVPIDIECSGGFCNGLGACVECNDESQCAGDRQCANVLCPSEACITALFPDGTNCPPGGKCLDGVCGLVYPCSEDGIRDAIARGGGTYTFDCPPGEEIIEIENEIVIDNDWTTDNEPDVILSGLQADQRRVVLDGKRENRVFRIEGGTWVILADFVITNGEPPEDSENGLGGGILNTSGVLELVGVQLADNQARSGGAVFNRATTVVRLSFFNNNTASPFDGGALWNSTTGELSVYQSTLVENSAQRSGGGIMNGGTLYVEDSMLATNEAFKEIGVVTEGGGIINFGVATLINSTVWNNGAMEGGAIFNSSDFLSPGDVTLVHVTVAYNRTYGGTANPGDIHSQGATVLLRGTLIQDTCSGTGFYTYTAENTRESPDNTCNTDDLPPGGGEWDFELGPLCACGGPTATLVPALTGDAIDVVPFGECYGLGDEQLPTDQRGVSRPQGATRRCDIGAVEVEQ